MYKQSSQSDDEFVTIDLTAPNLGSLPPFRIRVARHPVTVAQFAKFLDDGGYFDQRWWSEQGWLWREHYHITQPTYWMQPAYTDVSMPVTGVSFWEAEAYARYRGAQLPTEQEWYLISSNGGESRYPWGEGNDDPDPERANLAFFGEYGESERLPVDRSPKGVSDAGVADLIGNVAEWCLPGTDNELHSNVKYGVLRGGAFWHVPGVADAFFRDEVPLGIRDNQTGIRLICRETSLTSKTTFGTQIPLSARVRALNRTIRRPTAPFRQEGIPQDLTEANWRLRVHGIGVQPRSFSLADLKLLSTDVVSEPGTFVCVCRWGEHNVFTGVRISELLSRCGLDWVRLDHLSSLYLLQRSVPNLGVVYETTVPLREAVVSGAMLAWGMDGKALTPALGWPIRYVDLRLYGYKCVKCLGELVITDEYQRGWWEKACQYDIDGTILPGTITIVGRRAYRLEVIRRGRVYMPGNHDRGGRK
jgi:iron(II)-dependent oxidoreductase